MSTRPLNDYAAMEVCGDGWDSLPAALREAADAIESLESDERALCVMVDWEQDEEDFALMHPVVMIFTPLT